MDRREFLSGFLCVALASRLPGIDVEHASVDEFRDAIFGRIREAARAGAAVQDLFPERLTFFCGDTSATARAELRAVGNSLEVSYKVERGALVGALERIVAEYPDGGREEVLVALDKSFILSELMALTLALKVVF